MTAKLTKAKAILGVLLIGCILCALIFSAARLHSSEELPSPLNISTNEDCIAYLQAWGWSVSSSPSETLDLIFPAEPEASFQEYNALQKKQGMDLTPYRNQKLKRCTYAVLNYPERREGIEAHLYLQSSCVVAGDITATGADGFVQSLYFPK